MRTRSSIASRFRSRGMQQLCLAKDEWTEMPREVEWRSQVHPTANHRGEFPNHIAEAEHARRPSGQKLNQNVDIAIRTKVFAQHAAKEPHPRNAMPIAEIGELVGWKVDVIESHRRSV